MDVPLGISTLLVFAFGGCIGSFVNVVAYRLPRNISIVSPRSFCSSCDRPIPFWANIPILAYLGVRGRCNACGARIPFRDFLAELALASAAAYLYLNFSPADALARYLLCAGLFIAALIDYDWRVIPNAITLPGIPLGLLAASCVMPEVGWKSSLAGIFVGAGFLFLTGEAYLRLRGREGVGMGDVWLLGMVGAFLGWAGALFTLFVGSIIGTAGALVLALSTARASSDREAVTAVETTMSTIGESAPPPFLQTEIPFAPFLALAAVIFALFQPLLAKWYLS